MFMVEDGGNRRRRGELALSECATGEGGVITGNTGTRAMEMGFFPGAAVRVLRHEPGAATLVVQAGETRFVIPRDVAATVMIERGGNGNRRRRRWGRQDA